MAKEAKEQLTDKEQAQRLKSKYKTGKIFLIEVEDDDGNPVKGWLRNPTRQEAGMVAKLAGTDPVKSIEVLLNSVWLEGDDRIKTDDDLFFSAMPQLNNVLTIRNAELKKF